MAILVTGGAGYIGSVTVERLTAKGERVVVLDDLVYGHRESIDADIPFYQGSVGDQGLLARITKEHKIESCVHFAALAYVGESVKNQRHISRTMFSREFLSSVLSWTPACDASSFHPRVLCMGSRRNRPSERISRNGRKSLWLDEVHLGTSSRSI